MNVLAIPGSLRAASVNAACCRAAAARAPAGMNILVYKDLGALPLFNPDLEDALPSRVVALRGRASPQFIEGVMAGFLHRYRERYPNVHVTVIEAIA